jgi:hypothetical protein
MAGLDTPEIAAVRRAVRLALLAGCSSSSLQAIVRIEDKNFDPERKELAALQDQPGGRLIAELRMSSARMDVIFSELGPPPEPRRRSGS